MNPPIRILHVIESLGRGGAERQLVDLVGGMNRSRFTNTVYTLYDRNDFEPELHGAGVVTASLHLQSHHQALRGVRSLLRVLRDGNYAILHTWLYDADLIGRTAGKLAKVPLIVSALQNSWYEPDPALGSASKLKYELVRRLDSWTARWCQARFVASSRFVSRSMATRLGIARDWITTIYNAVDPLAFDPVPGTELDRVRDELNLRDCAPILICVARLVPEKGQTYLLAAMPAIVERFPRAMLLLVGAGGEAEPLREQMTRLGLADHVAFLGRRNDVKLLLQISDVFVFPSVRAEGLPVAVVEAMATRKPCVAWRVPPNPEVIEHGASGLLLELRNTGALAEAVCELAANLSLREAMGTRGRAIVETRFNVCHTVKQLETFYEEGLRAVVPPALSAPPPS